MVGFWKLLKPRRADLTMFLAGLYLLGCALIPLTFLIDWEITPYTNDDLVGPISSSVVAAVAGLANAYAAWLVFGRAKIVTCMLLTVVFAVLTVGSYCFGVRCAAFDPLYCPETAALRLLPVFWLLSIMTFAMARLLGLVATRLRQTTLHVLNSRRRSPVVWLGIPIGFVLWLIHTAIQSGLISFDAYSFEVATGLGLLATVFISLTIIPAAILVLVGNRFANSLILVGYFVVWSFIGIDIHAQFELCFVYGLTFLAGLFLSKWYYAVRTAEVDSNAQSIVTQHRGIGWVSLPAIAALIACLAFSGWSLSTYDLPSLISIKNPLLWEIAELNCKWGQEIRRTKQLSKELSYDVDRSILTISRRLTEREWRIVSKLPAQHVTFVSLATEDLLSLLAGPTGVTSVYFNDCQIDKSTLAAILASANPVVVSLNHMDVTSELMEPVILSRSLQHLAFHDCKIGNGAIPKLVNAPNLKEIQFLRCGRLWSEISKIQSRSQALKIHYENDDIVPVEYVRLERRANVDLMQTGQNMSVQVQAFDKRDAQGNIDWSTLAQQIDRDANGDIIRLDITGIELENKGLEAIGELKKLSWLGVSTDDCIWKYSRILPFSLGGFDAQAFDYSPIGNLDLLGHVRVETTAKPNNGPEPDVIADEKSLLGVVSQLPSIESLEIELSSTRSRELFLRVLPKFQKLKKLSIKSYDLELAEIRGLLVLPELRELVICSPMKELPIDEDFEELRKLAPHLVIRREHVERYEWPTGGDEVKENK